MSDAIRTRTGGVTLATIALAAATGLGANRLHLAKSLDANASDWCDEARGVRSHDKHCHGKHWDDVREDVIVCPVPYVPDDESPFAEPRGCVDEADDDHCFREEFRAQLEAWEAGMSYEEIREVSPTGASFERPTVVRRPPAKVPTDPLR